MDTASSPPPPTSLTLSHKASAPPPSRTSPAPSPPTPSLAGAVGRWVKRPPWLSPPFGGVKRWPGRAGTGRGQGLQRERGEGEGALAGPSSAKVPLTSTGLPAMCPLRWRERPLLPHRPSPSLARVGVRGKGGGADAVGSVEGLLHAVAVVDVDVDVEHAVVHLPAQQQIYLYHLHNIICMYIFT